MPARRSPRLRALLIPAIGLTWFSVPVFPASAFPATLDRVVPVRLHAGVQTVPLPIRTNLIAFSVEAGRRMPELEIRLDDGTWSEVQADPNEAADGAEAARGTPGVFSEPVWLGSASVLELRSNRAAPVRVHVVNSKGDLDRGPMGVLASIWQALTVPRAAEAAVPDQPIITRAQWGADESWVDGPPGPADELDAFVVHHTAGPNGYSRADVPAILRGIYRYHTKTRGWSDIGYNFLIDRFGRMYEGRAGSITEPMIGAHARGANDGSAGVSLIGTYSNVGPSDAMKRSLTRLIAWKADLHHVPLTGKVTLPDGETLNRISGHRDVNSTTCPGGRAYELLPWLRRAASAYGGPKIFKPRANATVLRPDGDGVNDVWRLLAWGNRDLVWTLEITNAAGVPVRTQQLLGRSLGDGASWDGRDDLGVLVPSGRYRWELRARDAGGEEARPADGALYVITDHFNGTVLRDGAGVYQLDGGTARPVPNLSLLTVFGRRGSIATGDAERGRYDAALLNAVPPRQGALLKTAAGELLIVDSATQVRAFSPSSVAGTLGYTAKTAILVSDADLVGTSRGSAISESDRHPVGTFVRDGTTVFRIRANDRIRASSFVVDAFGAASQVVDATALDLSLPIAAGSLTAPDGTIAWRDLAADAFWLLAGGERRLIADRAFFDAYGPWTASAIAATYDDIRGYPIGDPIR